MKSPKFLFVQLGRIGDMILFTSVFKSVKDKYPNCEIHVLAGRKNNSILEDNPFVDYVYIFDKSPLKLFPLVRKLKKIQFDYLIDPKDHVSGESGMIASFVNAGKKIGFNPDGKKIFDVTVPANTDNEDLHFIDRLFNALIHAGIEKPAQLPLPILFAGDDSSGHAKGFLEYNEIDDFIVFNLSANNPLRIWKKEKWAEIAGRLIEDGHRIVLSCVREERFIANHIIDSNPSARLYPATSIKDVIALVEKAKLVVTTDTSLIHIAAAFNIPVVGLFESDTYNYNKFRPLSLIAIPVRAIPPENKIADITADQVYDAITAAIERI